MNDKPSLLLSKDCRMFQERWKEIDQTLLKYRVQNVSKFQSFKAVINQKQYLNVIDTIYQLTFQRNGIYFELIIQKFVFYVDDFLTNINLSQFDDLILQPKLSFFLKIWDTFKKYLEKMNHLFMHCFDQNLFTQTMKVNVLLQAHQRFFLKIFSIKVYELNMTCLDIINEYRLIKLKKQKIQNLNIIKEYIITLRQIFQKGSHKSTNFLQKLEDTYIENSNSTYYRLMIRQLNKITKKEYIMSVTRLLAKEILILQFLPICNIERFRQNFSISFVNLYLQKLIYNQQDNLKSMLKKKDAISISYIYKLCLYCKCVGSLTSSYKNYIIQQVSCFFSKNTIVCEDPYKKGEILLNKIILFHSNMVSFIERAFHKNMTFYEIYQTILTKQLKQTDKSKISCAVIKRWNLDMDNQKISDADFLRSLMILKDIKLFLQVQNRTWVNNLKLGMIQRLLKDDSQQRFIKQEESTSILRYIQRNHQADLLQILQFFKRRKLNKLKKNVEVVLDFKQEQLQITVLKGIRLQRFVNWRYFSLMKRMSQLQQSFMKKQSFKQEQFEIISLISKVQWIYNVKNNLQVSVKANIIQFKIFNFLYSSDRNQTSIDELKKLILQQGHQSLEGNIWCMIRKKILFFNSGRVGVNYDIVSEQMIEIEIFYDISAFQQYKSLGFNIVDAEIVKIMKRKSQMRRSKLIHEVLSKEKIFQSEEAINQRIIHLINQNYIRQQGEMIIYVP